MNTTQWASLPLAIKLEILQKCDGKHYSLDEIFTCESCNKLFIEGAVL
jgi:hypothetical protein